VTATQISLSLVLLPRFLLSTMNEAFLSFVWKFRFYSPDLTTTNGEPVSVDSPGEPHRNSGPDFFNARVRIGGTLWAGNVEIHTKASDWYRHSHQSDEAYSGVILHVVYEADCDIMLSDQRTIPTVELKGFLDPSVQSRYLELIQSAKIIHCADSIVSVPDISRNTWFDRMLVERLEQRSELIQEALHFSKGNYEEAFYQILSGGFGFHINTLPFAMLARVLPLKLIQKHADDIRLCEALVFGQAGFLEQQADEVPDDGYVRELKQHYSFLARKYGLVPVERHLWKFLRMRPGNFPTIRLSQFTALVTSVPSLFASFIKAGDPSDYFGLLDVKASEYWNTHYVFGKPAPGKEKRLGRESASTLLINSVAPFLFMYGKWTGEEEHCRRAFSLLEALPPEKNRILDEWVATGLEFASAYHTQAALQLYRNHCIKKNCLNCSIGTSIIKSK
jgi:hypothetical protein